MAFEIFQEVGTRTKEYISITDNKNFGIPRTFLNKQGITTAHSAVLMYDKEAGKIAIYFTDADPAPKFAIKVRIPNETQGGLLAARSFFDLKDIDVAKYSGRYDDFEKVPLKDLGVGVEKEGIAYVLTLKVKTAEESNEQANENEQKQKDQNDVQDIPF